MDLTDGTWNGHGHCPITGRWSSRARSGGEGLRPLDELAAFEAGSGPDEGDEVALVIESMTAEFC
ncbi:hypothetical protein [Actinomadura rudentiformis]|uniref:hypothetical protein n=1 Tax=Actinomadura rudentiformis TaxID=359158 RepID=UPI00178C3D3D|nr:hypothetical protein [Actinomadura rudentiformis]